MLVSISEYCCFGDFCPLILCNFQFEVLLCQILFNYILWTTPDSTLFLLDVDTLQIFIDVYCPNCL